MSSLLSSLPDFQFPKENQPKNLINGGNSMSSMVNNNNNNLQSQTLQESNTVKLSIADYKRKLQKPNSTTSTQSSNNNPTSTSQLIMNSILSNTLNSSSSLLNNSNNNSSTNNSNNNTSNNSNNNNINANITSSLPSIPSYSVNLQAPQSLHELFRNFQS